MALDYAGAQALQTKLTAADGTAVLYDLKADANADVGGSGNGTASGGVTFNGTGPSGGTCAVIPDSDDITLPDDDAWSGSPGQGDIGLTIFFWVKTSTWMVSGRVNPFHHGGETVNLELSVLTNGTTRFAYRNATGTVAIRLAKPSTAIDKNTSSATGIQSIDSASAVDLSDWTLVALSLSARAWGTASNVILGEGSGAIGESISMAFAGAVLDDLSDDEIQFLADNSITDLAELSAAVDALDVLNPTTTTGRLSGLVVTDTAVATGGAAVTGTAQPDEHARFLWTPPTVTELDHQFDSMDVRGSRMIGARCNTSGTVTVYLTDANGENARTSTWNAIANLASSAYTKPSNLAGPPPNPFADLLAGEDTGSGDNNDEEAFAAYRPGSVRVLAGPTPEDECLIVVTCTRRVYDNAGAAGLSDHNSWARDQTAVLYASLDALDASGKQPAWTIKVSDRRDTDLRKGASSASAVLQTWVGGFYPADPAGADRSQALFGFCNYLFQAASGDDQNGNVQGNIRVHAGRFVYSGGSWSLVGGMNEAAPMSVDVSTNSSPERFHVHFLVLVVLADYRLVPIVGIGDIAQGGQYVKACQTVGDYRELFGNASDIQSGGLGNATSFPVPGGTYADETEYDANTEAVGFYRSGTVVERGQEFTKTAVWAGRSLTDAASKPLYISGRPNDPDDAAFLPLPGYQPVGKFYAPSLGVFLGSDESEPAIIRFDKPDPDAIHEGSQVLTIEHAFDAPVIIDTRRNCFGISGDPWAPSIIAAACRETAADSYFGSVAQAEFIAAMDVPTGLWGMLYSGTNRNEQPASAGRFVSAGRKDDNADSLSDGALLEIASGRGRGRRVRPLRLGPSVTNLLAGTATKRAVSAFDNSDDDADPVALGAPACPIPGGNVHRIRVLESQLADNINLNLFWLDWSDDTITFGGTPFVAYVAAIPLRTDQTHRMNITMGQGIAVGQKIDLLGQTGKLGAAGRWLELWKPQADASVEYNSAGTGTETDVNFRVRMSSVDGLGTGYQSQPFDYLQAFAILEPANTNNGGPNTIPAPGETMAAQTCEVALPAGSTGAHAFEICVETGPTIRDNDSTFATEYIFATIDDDGDNAVQVGIDVSTNNANEAIARSTTDGWSSNESDVSTDVTGDGAVDWAVRPGDVLRFVLVRETTTRYKVWWSVGNRPFTAVGQVTVDAEFVPTRILLADENGDPAPIFVNHAVVKPGVNPTTASAVYTLSQSLGAELASAGGSIARKLIAAGERL